MIGLPRRTSYDVVLLLVVLATSLWGWFALPDTVPLHWNAQGHIDRYGSKLEGLGIMPVPAVGSYLLCLALARTGDFSLVLLDVMLPKLSGLDVVKQLRSTDPELHSEWISARTISSFSLWTPASPPAAAIGRRTCGEASRRPAASPLRFFFVLLGDPARSRGSLHVV